MSEPTLRFWISEYEDGNLEIETCHIHYAFRDDLNYDDFAPGELYKIIDKITDICKAEGLTAYFIRR